MTSLVKVLSSAVNGCQDLEPDEECVFTEKLITLNRGKIN